MKNIFKPAMAVFLAVTSAGIALCGKLDSDANISDVCCGTAAKNDRGWYLARPRINGDPHGQAPMLWICNTLVDRKY